VFKLPKKFIDRTEAKLKNFKNIANSHRSKDVSEADTVTLVKDIFSDIFGFDKYTELTSEQLIRGQFCDLAVKIDGKIKFLIEVKSAGTELNDRHIQQAINYGSNQGVNWVILTNAIQWQMFKIKFGQPPSHELVASFNLIEIDPKKESDLQMLFLLAKEGISADAIQSFHQKISLLNRYTISQVLTSEPCPSVIRKEFRKLFPDVRVDNDAIQLMLTEEIIKREALEGEKVKEAKALIKKPLSKSARQAAKISKAENFSQ
jgi:hypothetical protein